MNGKNFEIILYDTEKLEGTAYCRKHKMKCKVEIENKSGGVALTYHARQQEHFHTNLALGKCKKCYYFNIKLELNGCEIEALYPYGKREIIRLTPICKDYSGRINYLKSIEIEVKREKFE